MALVVEGPTGSDGGLVGGRYRIEARIAKGGMGAVYRAFDHVQQRPLALKRLLADSDGRRRTRMFEREFHTLAGLKHPRIIDVYDYGVDQQGAYYTMELLDGRDLREIAPLPYVTACSYLRDVASSLGLLHARQLLHRDLSPRNVRITSDGRAKLIDFGALTGFGRSATVVGTAPIVPPEALCGAQLDQRADLYALGALAYWVLTGRHAYDVRAIAELPDAWRKPPPPPSELAAQLPELPPLPKALDDLVLALLSHNPLARPASAAELIGRLSSIGGLPPDTEPLSALSYLHGGHTLGRARERARLRRQLKRTLSESGAVVMLQAEAGMGSARILSELAIEARLFGAFAIVVDAAQHRGTYGVAEQIVQGLLAAEPERARAALREHAAELLRFMPGGESARIATQRLHTPATRTSVDPREARLRTQSALLGWLDRLTAERPLLIAVRGFQHADDSSASMLSALASACAGRRVLLVLAHNPDEPVAAPAAFASLKETAEEIVLRGLTRDEVRALVEASFGEVPNTERLAAWLHELTGGKPQDCRDLMQHLIEQGVIRFAEGVWALPQELSPRELPADIAQALDLRIARLSGEAQRLALALCVHRGTIAIDRCLALAELERIQSPFRALIELEQRGVLIASEDRLRFSHAAVREAALRRLAEPERRRLHAQLGTLISREGGSDVEALLDAGWHLLHGGQEGRGADLLAEAGVALSYDADDMPAAIPALEAALVVFRQQGRSKRELARLLGPLAIAGFYTDRRVAETHGDEAVAVMQDVLGLSLARRIAPLLGTRASALLGLSYGFVRALFAVGPRRVRSAFQETLMVFITAICVLTGMGTMTLDARRARRFARLLEPLRVLGNEAIALVHRLTEALTTLPEDRVMQTIASCHSVLARFEDPRPIRDFPEKARALLYGAALYACGSLETFREDPEALRIADQLETMGIKLFEMFANQIRANYHGLRGEELLAERYRQRVELFAVQAGSSWQAEVWTPASSTLYYATTRDLIGLRRAAGELARLAEEIPSLRLHAQMALAGCHMLRGDAESARAIGHPLVAGTEPRSHIGWGAMLAGDIWSLCEIDPEQARQLGRRVLALYDADDRTVSSMVVPVVVQLALVEARLGEFQAAAERIDDFLAELGERGGPATRGSLHEARARIALSAGDPVSARLHFAQMEQWFRPTENPALVARCEQLRRELEAGDPAERPTSSDTLDLGLSPTEEVRRAIRGCASRKQRFDRVLDLLLEHTGGSGGQLFSYEGGLLVSAVSRGKDPPEAVRERLKQHLAGLERDREPDVTESASGVTELDSGIAPRGERSEEHRFFLLATGDGKDRGTVAAAVIAVGRRPLQVPPAPMLAAMAEALLDREPETASASR